MVTSNTDSAVDIRSVENRDELRQALDLIAACFADRYPESVEWLRIHATTCPRYQPEHVRVAMRGEQVVAALRITSETLLIGESRLKVGGVGWMCVAPGFRGKGIARELHQEAVHYLHEHGFLAALSFDDLECSQAMGFTPAFEERLYRFVVNDDVLPALAEHRVRAIKPGDLANLHRIHKYSHRHVSCGLLREQAHLSNKWRLLRKAQVLTNRDGLVDAYFLPSECGARVTIAELGARSDELNATLMTACQQYVRRGLHHDLHISVPREHAFSRYLASSYPMEYGRVSIAPIASMRVLDIGETLESMMPEWEACVGQSLLRELYEEVTLMVDGAAFRIRVRRGAVDISRIPGRNKLSINLAEFTQLLTGCCPVTEVFHRSPRLVNAEGRAILQTLFPTRNPSFSRIECW